MSGSAPNGYISVPRGVHDDPLLRPAPFTEAQALLWMWEEAVWKPWGVPTGWGRIASLERGQLSRSIRDLARLWQWHACKVQRFLKRLADADRITTAVRGGQCVIAIHGYDECNGRAPGDTAPQPATPSNTAEIREPAAPADTTGQATDGAHGDAIQSPRNSDTTTGPASRCKDEETPKPAAPADTVKNEERYATKEKNPVSKKDTGAKAPGALPRFGVADDLFGTVQANPQPAKEPRVRTPEGEARDLLFQDLLDPLGALLHTDTKGARAAMGKLLRASGNNAAHVREAFGVLQAQPGVADPESYLMGVVRRRMNGLGAPPAPVSRRRFGDAPTTAQNVAAVQRAHLRDLAKQGQSASPETAPSGVADYPADITIQLEALP